MVSLSSLPICIIKALYFKSLISSKHMLKYCWIEREEERRKEEGNEREGVGRVEGKDLVLINSD